MSQCYPSPKPLTGSLQRIAHVAEEEEFGWRNAIRMRRNSALANIYFPMRKEVAQMVVGPAVTEPEFEHVPFQFPD